MATPEERRRAMAVHSLDDESRVRTGGDETDVVLSDAGIERVHEPVGDDDARDGTGAEAEHRSDPTDDFPGSGGEPGASQPSQAEGERATPPGPPA
jgi:hypothetical protein